MSLTPSTMLELGTPAPDFDLADPAGNRYNLDSFKDAKALLVIFMCNHCPYVIHIRDELTKFADEYLTKGLAIVAINSNDYGNYPDDSPERMAEAIKTVGYKFPYLVDETQEVAQAYRAACTPDLYLFDGDLKLVYRGQFDDSRPGKDIPVTGKDMRAATDAVLTGSAAPNGQKPSMGCNIKWRSGNEPNYYG